MPPIRLCFYGDARFARSLELFRREAKESQYFNRICEYHPADLAQVKVTTSEDLDFIARNSRGGGYWIWKFLILLDQMERAAPGEVIIYADAGCTIGFNARQRATFTEWIRAVEEAPHRAAFQTRYPEEEWTKSDLFSYLKIHDPFDRRRPQFMGGIQIYLNTPENHQFVSQMLQVARAENYFYLTDAPSREPHRGNFKEHRHDQSIFSLSCKKYGTTTLRMGRESSMPIFPARRRLAYHGPRGRYRE